MRKLLLATALALAVPAAATPPIMPPTPMGPPRLLVVIAIDGLSGALWDEYRPHFTGGLARLAAGTVFRNGYQSHAATETCPGHSTILTGSLPARTGIVANRWLDAGAARPDKMIYCAEDETATPLPGQARKISAAQLRTPTLGDILKSRTPASRNFAVAGKERAAVMLSGRSADQRWFWDGNRFATDLVGKPPARVAALVNSELGRRIGQGSAGLLPAPPCEAKSRAYEVAPGLTVGNGRLDRAPGDRTAFRASPDFDGAVLALAAGLVQEAGLGRGPATTDILSIGLTATDVVMHSFGTGGQEMCLQMLALDRELQDFFAVLDRSGLAYAVVLTGDHGGADIPERLRDRGIGGAARADPALEPGEMGKKIGIELGLSGPILIGSGPDNDFWADHRLSDGDRARVIERAVSAYRGHPQVAAVFTRAQLAAEPLPTGDPRAWSLMSRVRAAFDRRRSGDFVVVLAEHVNPISRAEPGIVSTEGTAWDHDRRVPIVFWRHGMARSERGDAVDTTAIMPTLAAMLGLRDLPEVDGRCLSGIAGIVCATH